MEKQTFTNKDDNKDKDLEWKVRSANRLKEIFETASLAPVFRLNPKYCKDKFEKIIPYISYEDVLEHKFIIRARPLTNENNDYDIPDKHEIIIQYNNIEELIEDGWRLSPIQNNRDVLIYRMKKKI